MRGRKVVQHSFRAWKCARQGRTGIDECVVEAKIGIS